MNTTAELTEELEAQVRELLTDTAGIRSGFVRSLKVNQLVRQRGLCLIVLEEATRRIGRQEP